MGKGDKKTRKGKLTMGSYGVTRPRKKKGNKINPVTAQMPAPAAAPKKEPKAPAKKKTASAEGKGEAKPKKAAPKKAKKEE